MTILTYTLSFKCTAPTVLDNGQKQISPDGNHSTTNNFDRLPYSYPMYGWYFFSAKMTAKDDPTIICSHLVAETSALVGRKK